jgi:small basic protein (TIGR04137 family)
MSIHPSLKESLGAKRHKSVLTKIERIKILLDKDTWSFDRSVFGLPKVKVLKVKIKKPKAAEAAAAEGAAAAPGAEGAAPAAAAAQKPKAAAEAKAKKA